MNKYLEKSSSLSAATLHFLTGGATTHIAQNIATRAGIRSKHVASTVANSFASGIKGVHDTSVRAKLLSGLRGTLAPDLEIMHHEAWRLGNKLGPIINSVSPRTRAGLRMLSEGKFSKFNKLKSHMKFTNEIAEAVDQAQKVISVRAALKFSPRTAANMETVANSRDNPFLSNIIKNIHRGKLPAKHSAGPPSEYLPTMAGVGSGLLVGDIATAGVNAIKNSSNIDAVKKNKYLGKVVDKLHNIIIKHPVEKGWTNPHGNFLHGFNNKVLEYGWSPTSQTLKHTSSEVARTLEDGHIDPSKVRARLLSSA